MLRLLYERQFGAAFRAPIYEAEAKEEAEAEQLSDAYRKSKELLRRQQE